MKYTEIQSIPQLVKGKDLGGQKLPPEVFCKMVVLKNFTNFNTYAGVSY